MTIGIGETKEEEREIFQALKQAAKERRQRRAQGASLHEEKVRLLVDGGTFSIDPNGTWNWKLKGMAGQYWPTKGRWQYTSSKLVKKAKFKQKMSGDSHYSWALKATQFGGGILKFINWLEKQQ